MPALTFDDIVSKQEAKMPRSSGALTFDDLLPKNIPLEKTHTTKGPLTFQDMTPEERVDKFGKIEKFTVVDRAIDRTKRFMNVGANALMGDIPFARNILPENIRESEPQSKSEKVIAPLISLGRDIYGYGKISKAIKPFADIQKVTKTGRFIAKAVAEGFKGGVLGAMTADSEDPVDIARKAGIYGAIGAGSVPAIEAVSWAGTKVVNALGKSKNLNSIGEWLGLKLRENKANDLVRKRHGEIDSRLIDSEKYISDLSKQITPEQNKALAFIVESGNLDSLDPGKVKDAAISIRKYLDKAHAGLMKDYGKDVNFVKDYIPHMWDIPKNKEKAVINWFMTRNPHLKQRRIDTIQEGIKKFGLKPKYEKVTDVLRVYDQVRIKSAANLKFVQDLMKLEDGGVKLIQRIDKAPGDWKTIEHPAVRRAMSVGTVKKNIPIKNTETVITETLEKIRTIERTVASGQVQGSQNGPIRALERVMADALESRGITGPEAKNYLERLKSAYAGADIGDTKVGEKISEEVKKKVSRIVSEIETKYPVDIPILMKVPVKVHPDIYPDVKAILDTWQPGKAERVLDTINTSIKQSVLTLSLFHHMALTETGIAAKMGKDVLNVWNPVKVYKAFKSGNHKAFLKNIPLAKEGVRDGLTIGSISDIEGGRTIVEALKRAEKSVGDNAVALGIKVAVRKPLELNNKFLWDYLHTTYKLNAYQKIKLDMIKRFPEKSTETIGKEVAQFVNDTFGGQPWEIMAKTKQWRQFSRFALLSPDWVLSTMKQALSPFGVGAASKAGVEIRKEMGKDFWQKALVYFGGSMNILNYAYTKAHTGQGRYMWDNPPGKKTYLFIGYNDDGTERYLRWGKQFRELAEAINNPFEVAGRKISPLIRIAKHQLYPDTLWQKEIVESDFWDFSGGLKGWASSAAGSVAARGSVLLKDVTPYSITQQQKVGSFTPLSFVAPVSRGMTPYRARRLFRTSILRKNIKLFKATYKSSLDNEIDPDPIFKQAVASLKSEKTFEARLEANKLVAKYRKLDAIEGKFYFEKLLNSGKITPLVAQQVAKILKTKGKVIKKRKQFYELLKKESP